MRKKSPKVISFIRYSGSAKIRPKSTRQSDAPSGSEISPRNPSSRNVAEMPSTVSAPNHVAKTIASTTAIGRCRPAVT